jgi:HEPN domain-containing protein
MARAYMRQASGRLRHAREALKEGNYPYVVRQCQEAVELLLKAVLRLVGIEPPKWHDVGRPHSEKKQIDFLSGSET